jgi:hypothetical protein
LEVADNNKWIDVIDNIIDVYNNEVHSSINETPHNVLYNHKIPNTNMNFEKIEDIEVGYNIGDHVRVVQNKKNMDKKSLIPTYSSDVFEIIDKNGNRYTVKDIITNEKERKKYLKSDMIYAKGNKNMGKNKKQETIVHKKEVKVKRRNRATKLDTDKEGKIIIPKSMIPARPKREIKKVVKYGDYVK